MIYSPASVPLAARGATHDQQKSWEQFPQLPADSDLLRALYPAITITRSQNTSSIDKAYFFIMLPLRGSGGGGGG